MPTPPHSVRERAAAIEQHIYEERNNFLHLLLGLISLSERVLTVIPELAGEPPPAPPESTPSSATDNHDGPLR